MQDILEELAGTILEGISFSQKQQKQISNSGNSQSSLALINLTQEEQSVYSILKDGDILSLEEMMEKLGLSFSQLSSTLSMMEINGILGKRTDGKFEIK